MKELSLEKMSEVEGGFLGFIAFYLIAVGGLNLLCDGLFSKKECDYE